MSAGLAATAASLVTSRFGVAGTLLGAALTAMIITGGSAILRAYLESLSGRVREVPTKLRSRRERKTGGADSTMPGRPDLKDNFVGRMRAALGWFSHLPTLRRRSILMKGLLAAAVAFVSVSGARVGGREGHRQQPLLRPVGEVPLRRSPRHPPHGLRRHGRGLLALGRRGQRRRPAKPGRPRAAEREPVRGRPARLRKPGRRRRTIGLPNPPLHRSPHLHQSPHLHREPAPSPEPAATRARGLTRGRTAGRPIQRLAGSRPVTDSLTDPCQPSTA